MTGATYADLQYTFRIHKSTLSIIIPGVRDAIYARLEGDYLEVTVNLFFTSISTYSELVTKNYGCFHFRTNAFRFQLKLQS